VTLTIYNLCSSANFTKFLIKMFATNARSLSRSTATSVTRTASRQLAIPSEEYFNRPGPWDSKDLGSLLTANKAWAQRMVDNRPDFFQEIKRGHAPKILWIGCSDARVPANEIIGEPPGSVFVHRNIANMVVNTDFSCMSVIQFAVSVLKVKHIIVCGHYDCGGIKASLDKNDYSSPLCNWVRNIRDTYRLHREELNAITDLRMRQRRLVELNVIEQVGPLPVLS
jgi:carbonic anhydrase